MCFDDQELELAHLKLGAGMRTFDADLNYPKAREFSVGSVEIQTTLAKDVDLLKQRQRQQHLKAPEVPGVSGNHQLHGYNAHLCTMIPQGASGLHHPSGR